MDKLKLNDEILDLVDENDNIIGEVKRSVANGDPRFIHREVGITIIDEQDRVLFNKRSQNKKHQPSWWTTVGGHIGKGEEPLVAAHRELKEEMGFDTKLVFIGKFLRRLANETHFSYKYLARYTDQKIIFNPDEMDEVRFFTEKEIDEGLQSGIKFGQTSVSVAKDFWAGKFDSVLESGSDGKKWD